MARRSSSPLRLSHDHPELAMHFEPGAGIAYECVRAVLACSATLGPLVLSVSGSNCSRHAFDPSENVSSLDVHTAYTKVGMHSATNKTARTFMSPPSIVC